MHTIHNIQIIFTHSIIFLCLTADSALLSTVEELQSSLDRANEKLQSNHSLLIERDKEISKLSADVDTVSLFCCHNNNIVIFNVVIYSYLNN